jgi:hypothetical protein
MQSALRKAHPKFAQLSDVRLVAAHDLPGLIPADAIAVSYIVGEGSLAALLVDAEGQVRYRDLGRAPELAATVDIWRRINARDHRQGPSPAGIPGFRVWRLASGGYRLLPADVRAPKGGAGGG